MPWEPDGHAKIVARAYLGPAAILVAIVVALNLAFAHLASPAEKISACAFAVSAMTLFTTLNERKGALRAATYGKRVDAVAEDARRIGGFYRAAYVMSTLAQADGSHTERVREARQRLDDLSEEYSTHMGVRFLYFDRESLDASDRFIGEAAALYRTLNGWSEGEPPVDDLRGHDDRLRKIHTDYYTAARRGLGIERLTDDAKRLIGINVP